MRTHGITDEGAGMRLRSLLFVPADRPERFAKAASTGADALIIDLEDSVSREHKEAGRQAVAELLQGPPLGPHILVRINPLDSAFIEADLMTFAGLRPAGIVLPKAEGARSIVALEANFLKHQLVGTPILPIATETPAAIFQLGTYAEISSSLAGLTWGAEDLPAAIGAVTSREDDGSYTPPYQLARSLTLFAAHAAGVSAIETVFPDFKNLDGLAVYASRAARDGFTGMMAIHPSQVATINSAFTPSENELAQAQRIVEIFEQNPGQSAFALNGKMIDFPHLKQARRILERASK